MRAVAFVFDQQVLAEEIELISVEAGLIRALESLAHLDIEDLEAQTAGGVAIFDRLREAHAILAHLGVNVRARRRLRGSSVLAGISTVVVEPGQVLIRDSCPDVHASREQYPAMFVRGR